MATKYYKWRGIASYAKVYEPDQYENGPKKWMVNLHPDPETIADIKGSGLKLKLKDKTTAGAEGKFFTFNCPVQKEIRGEMVSFTPPVITDDDGEVLVGYEQDDDGTITRYGEPVLIGNGSEITVEVAVFDAGHYGKGHRLLGVRIHDLVEYDPDAVGGKPEVDKSKPATTVRW